MSNVLYRPLHLYSLKNQQNLSLNSSHKIGQYVLFSTGAFLSLYALGTVGVFTLPSAFLTLNSTAVNTLALVFGKTLAVASWPVLLTIGGIVCFGGA